MFDHPIRRIRHALQASAQILRNARQDLRLLLHRWRGGVAIRGCHTTEGCMVVRIDEEVGRDIYFYGEYEKKEAEYVLSEIRETDTCFDLGANVGYYTLALARRVSLGSVHSFEPVPVNYHILSTNVLLNGLKNVRVNQTAIGRRTALASFTVTDDSAFSSMQDTKRKAIGENIEVHVSTLDSYCDSNNIHKIDFLKADVEGAENEVLQGAHNILSNPSRRPRLLMLELVEPMLQRFGSSIDEVVQLLAEYGYSPFVCGPDRLMPFVREHYTTYYNVLFVNEARANSLGEVQSVVSLGEPYR